MYFSTNNNYINILVLYIIFQQTPRKFYLREGTRKENDP